MKALLEFSLPEEREDHELALNGFHYKSVIDEIFTWIRQQEKYNETLTEDQRSLLESLREFVAGELNE